MTCCGLSPMGLESGSGGGRREVEEEEEGNSMWGKTLAANNGDWMVSHQNWVTSSSMGKGIRIEELGL